LELGFFVLLVLVFCLKSHHRRHHRKDSFSFVGLVLVFEFLVKEEGYLQVHFMIYEWAFVESFVESKD
jgi:hypothetical protein